MTEEFKNLPSASSDAASRPRLRYQRNGQRDPRQRDRYRPHMISPRFRKLVGGLALLVYLGGYIWVASMISDHLPDNGALRLTFYAIAGLGWGLPILPLLSWMDRAQPRLREDTAQLGESNPDNPGTGGTEH